MRRYVLLFHRGEELFAELHLNLDSDFYTIESLKWFGNPRAEQVIGPFPELKSTSYDVWLIRARKAAHREGLVLTGRYEGEEKPDPGCVRNAHEQRERHKRYLEQSEGKRLVEGDKR